MKLYDKVVSEENDREVDDLAGRDLVDDTIEMRTQFTENQFDKIIIDIPKTRLAIKFMLKFMDLSKIDDNEISLMLQRPQQELLSQMILLDSLTFSIN